MASSSSAASAAVTS
jgi:hypothetical protein